MRFLGSFFFILFVFPSVLLAQNKACKNSLDSIKVKRIAKRHNSYWTKAWQYPPSVIFNEESCEWMVVSHKIKISNKGDCKNSNGCTITTRVTLMIDATTGRVKDRIELKHVVKNWE
jgi:hypothetical protein